jgi:hypothetical protein
VPRVQIRLCSPTRAVVVPDDIWSDTRAVRSSCRLAALVLLVAASGCERARSTTTATPASTDDPDRAPDNEFTLPYGARTIHVYADPALDGEVARLFLLFEDLRAEAVPLTEQTRLPIGWTTLSFTDDGERLVVQEPDYDNEPESRTRSDISVSLATLKRQRRVLDQVGVAGAAINFDEHVLTIRGVLEQAEVMLIRVESPGGRMTGWRLTPAAGIEDSDEIDSLPVYEILAARPELLDAMLLPPGYLVLYSGDQLTTIVNQNDEIVWEWTRDGELPRTDEGELSGPDRALDPTSDPGSDPGRDPGTPRPRPQPLLEPLE